MSANHRVFPVGVVSTLTDLSTNQLRAWVRDGFYRPERWSAETAQGGILLYSFRDVVGLRAISKLYKEHGIPIKHLKNFGDWLKSRYNDPWSSLRFKVDGQEVMFDCPDTGRLTSSRPPGQMIVPGVVSTMEPFAQEVENKVTELWKRRPNDEGEIRRYPGIMGGVPLIAGTRIPTSVIAEFHDAGYSSEQIQAEYPQLTIKDIEKAIRFERGDGDGKKKAVS